jgi:UDP-N-acetyl-D-glucosamine dehydrogenase
MPAYVLNKIISLLGGQVKGKKICVVGLSYKPDISDLRSSPSLQLWDQLQQVGAIVFYHDNFHKTYQNKKNINLSESYFDLSIIAVQHSNLDMVQLRKSSHLIVNAIGEKIT